jgi:hypothetical protein
LKLSTLPVIAGAALSTSPSALPQCTWQSSQLSGYKNVTGDRTRAVSAKGHVTVGYLASNCAKGGFDQNSVQVGECPVGNPQPIWYGAAGYLLKPTAVYTYASVDSSTGYCTKFISAASYVSHKPYGQVTDFINDCPYACEFR